MEAKFCPDIDEGDDSRVSITVYGERPGELRVFECAVLFSSLLLTFPLHCNKSCLKMFFHTCFLLANIFCADNSFLIFF